MIVKEGSSLTVRARFCGTNGGSYTPNEVRYKVINPDTAVELQAWDTVSPAVVVDCNILGSTNDTSSGFEPRQVIVQADYTDDSSIVTEEIEYFVQDLGTI